VFASALIKKRKYWPKYVDGDAVDAHFESKAVGATDSLKGKMHDIPFHIYAMKEPDYIMKLMSTYGTNELQADHPTKRVYKDSEKNTVTTNFCYPEVVSNHFKFRHAVDDHNAKRHSPISLEYVWATKYWPHRPFSFLLAISEVNTNLAEAYFTRNSAPRPQLEFRKLLAKDLINNKYLEDEQNKLTIRRSKRQATISTHSLLSLPPSKNLKAAKSSKLQANIHRLHALGDTEK